MSKKKIKIPGSLTRVTAFSKILALILILIFVLFGFYLGMQYQKKLSSLGIDVTPTPTPVVTSQTSCQKDSDCILANTDTANTTAYCCPNTKCIDLGSSNVTAVNAAWFGSEKSSVCSGHYMCPMIAVLCTRPITENNRHYQARCVQNTCQKVRE